MAIKKNKKTTNHFFLLVVILLVATLAIFSISYFFNQKASKILGSITSPTPIGQTATWNLIFDDEFDGTSLDTTKWVPAFPWGNTSTTTPLIAYRPENVVVSNGTLKLIAKKETYLNPSDGKTYQYTSGMISSSTTPDNFSNITSYKFMPQYGYMEMRAKLPHGQGLWPAFWALPAAGKWPPEIDTMENLGNDSTTLYMHYHYLNSSGTAADYGTSYTGPDYSVDFHTYAVDWEPGLIIWYVDGVERNRFASSYVTADPLYLIANFQVGGAWPGNPDSTTIFPANYEIDYIRFWKQPTATPVPTITPTATPLPTPSVTPSIVPSRTPTPTIVSTATNFIVNSSFEFSSLSPWYLQGKLQKYSTMSKDNTTATSGLSSAKIVVSRASTHSWDVQFVQSGVVLNSGTIYKISFWGKANSPRTLPVVIQKVASPYTEYFRQNVYLTTSWQNYTLAFTSPVSDSNSKLSFALGSVTGTVWFDDVYLGQ